jgi:hypothetical protein
MGMGRCEARVASRAMGFGVWGWSCRAGAEARARFPLPALRTLITHHPACSLSAFCMGCDTPLDVGGSR